MSNQKMSSQVTTMYYISIIITTPSHYIYKSKGIMYFAPDICALFWITIVSITSLFTHLFKFYYLSFVLMYTKLYLKTLFKLNSYSRLINLLGFFHSYIIT